MQRACVMLGSVNVNIELPEPEAEVMPGVRWGDVAAFPTPAYWAYQVMARRIERNAIRYRLGTSLKEEVGACLLGGHGIPAKVGVVAFEHLRRRGAFAVLNANQLGTERQTIWTLPSNILGSGAK